MNREQKAAAIAEIVAQIKESEAVFAVDFRGISVPQAADVRTRLRDADATFRVVKNTLTERAADEAGAEALKPLLEGPTALTFVRGDAATAAKAIATFNRETQLLTFKGGLLDGDALDAEQIVAISRLPVPRRPLRPARRHGRLADHRPRPRPERAPLRGRDRAERGPRQEGARRAARRRGARRREPAEPSGGRAERGGRARGARPEAEAAGRARRRPSRPRRARGRGRPAAEAPAETATEPAAEAEAPADDAASSDDTSNDDQADASA